ncbi:MAG: hypothetical protein AAGE05_14435 [Pseudomonadota bacterium]
MAYLSQNRLLVGKIWRRRLDVGLPTRIRKRFLDPHERKKEARKAEAA